MNILREPPVATIPPGTSSAGADTPPAGARETLLSHLLTSVLYTVVSVAILGILYPLLIAGIGAVVFPYQAHGSMVARDGKPVGSELIGQLFSGPRYFWGRPSAAGKNGYDPTSTGGTNLAPTSKKLIDATREAIAAQKKSNPDAAGEPPMDLVTTSGSGIDPDISPAAAYYQAPRVAKARNVPLQRVRALIAAHITGRTFGILGEPRVNVLRLNGDLDAGLKRAGGG